MERKLILTLLVLLFAIGANVAPVDGGSSFIDGGSLELGVTYALTYNTSVVLRELQASSRARAINDVGFQVLADADCAVLWQQPAGGGGDSPQQLLLVTLAAPRLLVRSRRAPRPDGFAPHASALDAASPTQLLLLTDTDSQQTRLWRHPDDSGGLANLARGLAGLLITRPEGTYRETDASGECDVTYSAESLRTLLKWKTGCAADRADYSGTGAVLATELTSKRVTRYTLGAEGLQEAESEETHRLSPAVSSTHGTLVSAYQRLQVTGRTRSATVVEGASIEKAVAAAGLKLGWIPQPASVSGTSPEDGCPSDGCQKLSELVSELKRGLAESAVGSAAAARAHVALVLRLRSATQQQVSSILKDVRHRESMLSILDAAGAAQTMPVHSAVKKALNWQASDAIEREERYLVSLATATHPPLELVHDLVKEARRHHASPELHQSIQLTAASLAAALCSRAAEHSHVCEEFGGYLVSRLGTCDDEECCLPLLRALANLRQESTLPALVSQVTHSEEEGCRQEALRALSAFPVLVTAPLRPLLVRVFSETDRYSSTSRLLAADLLLASPAEGDVALLLRDLASRQAAEVSAYTLQRVTAAAQRSPLVEQELRQVMSDRRVNNYDVLSLGALSSVLERRVAGSQVLSAGFDSALEVGRARQLKRSTLRAGLATGSDSLDVLSFSVAAAGLSGLLGSPDPDDAAEASARLELALLGRQLRPRQLFGSQGELMGLLWSGVGSERTSALRGTVPLHDHRQLLPLQNGLTALLSQISAVTFDFAGQVEVSLWSRTANALVDDSAALLLRTSAALDTPWLAAHAQHSLAVQAQLTANTDVDFSDGPKTCARISQQPVTLREAVRKQERVSGSQYRLRRVRRRLRRLSPVTFALNRVNAENCQLMFGGGR